MKSFLLPLLGLAGLFSTVHADDVVPFPSVNGIPVMKTPVKANADAIQCFDVELTKAGELAAILGDNIENIDSLVVAGPINDADITAMWKATFFGRTEFINMEKAVIENNRLPDKAFWNMDEQMSIEDGVFYSIKLKKIILPESLTEIGELALAYAVPLTAIEFPSSLRVIGESAFHDCRNLSMDVLEFNDGLQTIGDYAFMYCYSLSGKVVFPSSLERIGAWAFYVTALSEADFAPGLQYIGMSAFGGCRLKEVALPDGCRFDDMGSQFSGNYELEKVTLPADLEEVPQDMFLNCMKIGEINFPKTLVKVGKSAFSGCRLLPELMFSEGLERIEADAFSFCSEVKRIALPSTLTYIGAKCFEGSDHLQELYCAATVPPECGRVEAQPEDTPFGTYCPDNNLPHSRIPVYVPVGTQDAYLGTWGWDYFNNFVETTSFPTSVGEIVATPEKDVIYDLMGRKVQNPVKGGLYIQNGRKLIWSAN